MSASSARYFRSLTINTQSSSLSPLSFPFPTTTLRNFSSSVKLPGNSFLTNPLANTRAGLLHCHRYKTRSTLSPPPPLSSLHPSPSPSLCRLSLPYFPPLIPPTPLSNPFISPSTSIYLHTSSPPTTITTTSILSVKRNYGRRSSKFYTSPFT